MASLSKDQVLPEIAKRLNELYEKKIHLEEALKSAPEGNLRTAKKGKAFQFYLITEKADSKGKYLSLKNPVEKELVKKLAQRDYDKKALRQSSPKKRPRRLKSAVSVSFKFAVKGRSYS